MDTNDYIKRLQERASETLKACLKTPRISPGLEEAMLYAVYNGGKRIRPVLAYATAEAVGGKLEDADHSACAVELIHAYSLVHDDLPSMDNDELRRGQPTCHIKFDEATAILAGDALQSLAFELLARDIRGTPELALEKIATLARASGWEGMVAGQSLDMNGEGNLTQEGELARIHRYKTGALINASVRLGALSAGCTSREQLDSLETFATCIGLAFQVKDDILDVEGDTATLGKQQGKDQSLNKATYPALLGLDEARVRLHALFEQGTAALSVLGDRAANLAAIASYIIERKH